MAEPKESPLMEKIVSLCKRRGFIFQSSEIYGGINGFWDYGPLGAELKRNVKELWWNTMTREREDVAADDGASLRARRGIWIERRQQQRRQGLGRRRGRRLAARQAGARPHHLAPYRTGEGDSRQHQHANRLPWHLVFGPPGGSCAPWLRDRKAGTEPDTARASRVRRAHGRHAVACIAPAFPVG